MKNKKPGKKSGDSIYRYIGLGAEIAATLLLPIGIGFAADSFFQTRVTFTLVGAGLGLLGFIWTAIKISKRM